MKAVRVSATVLCALALSISVGEGAGIASNILRAAVGQGALTIDSIAGCAARAASEHPLGAAAAAGAFAVALAAPLAKKRPAVSIAISAVSLAVLALSLVSGWQDGLVLGDTADTAAALAAAALVLLGMLSSVMSAFKGNFDTGAEHGAERMATVAEARALADTRRKRFYNNLVYSQNAGMVFTPLSRAHDAAQHAMNMNEMAIGTSGMGKTYHCVLPDILNSLGDSVRPLPAGGSASIRNAVEHLRARLGWNPADPVLLAAAVKNPRRAARPKSKRKASLGQGWDVVHTDPKGDTLRDTGHLLAAAGVDIKMFNTIDFNGLCYNPLADAYIKPHEQDVKDVRALESTVSVGSRSAGSEDDWGTAQAFPLRAGSYDPGIGKPPCALAAGRMKAQAQGVMDYRQRLTAADLEGYDLDDVLQPDPDNPAAGRVAYLEWETGTVVSGEAPGTEASGQSPDERKSDSEVMRLLRQTVYRRTRCFFSIAVANPDNPAGDAADVRVEVKLDPALSLDRATLAIESADEHAGVDADLSALDSDNVLVLVVRGLEYYGVANLSFEADIYSMRVPDGIQLAKTVECLVANLKHDEGAGGKNDAFWEDCKRLELMALISAAYEWYDDPADRTLNTVMRLLNMALPEEGGFEAMSPLGYLMKRWETGEEFCAAADGAAAAGLRSGAGAQKGGEWKKDAGRVAHSRANSLALHCFYAAHSGAKETVQSVVITCQTAFVSLTAPEVKRMLSRDELHLETLGDAGQRQALFIVTKDTNSPYDFLTALLVYQAIDLCLDKAYARGGRLARHVRFVLDEAMTIGKIPILVRALAVVRSRNMSVSMYMQAASQMEALYGEKDADTIRENCSVVKYLGSNGNKTLEELQKIIGDETIYSLITNRSYQGGFGAGSVSESIQSNQRAVRSAAQLRQMERSKMIVNISGEKVIEDDKYLTSRHPYYAYVCTSFPRSITSPVARVTEKFDFARYVAEREARRGGGNRAWK